MPTDEAESSANAPDDSRPTPDSEATTRDDKNPLRRVVLWLLGIDLFALLVPRGLEQLAPYVTVLARLLDSGGIESVVFLSFVIGYSDVVWALGWLVLTGIAVWYAPELIRPEATDWPDSHLLRGLTALPMLWGGLLAETFYRSVLTGVIGPIAVPITVPLTPLTVGGNLLVVVVLFGWVFYDSAGESTSGRPGHVGYVLRGVTLVTILSLFFALFSLISPFGEVFAVLSYVVSSADLPSDPAERLVEAVTTIWQHGALALMTVYVAATLATVGSIVLAARLRAPPDFLSVAPVSAVFLVVLSASTAGYVYTYCERTLRQFRHNFDPTVDPTHRVYGVLIPTAVMASLIAGEYVFGDPTAGPTPVGGVVGLLAAGAPLLNVVGATDVGRDDDDGESITVYDRDAATVEKHIRATAEDRQRTTVRFDVESRHDEPLDVSIIDTVPSWLNPETVEFREEEPDNWDIRWDTLRHTTVVPPDGSRTLGYDVVGHHVVVGSEQGTRDVHHQTTIHLGRETDSIESDRRHENSFSINVPSYHLPPIAISIFFGLLGAAAPTEGVFLIAEWVDATPGGYPLTDAVLRFLQIFSLVTLTYVPVGISTHLDELRTLGVDLSSGNDEPGPSVRRFRLLSAASLTLVAGLVVSLADPFPASVTDWVLWFSGASAGGLIIAADGLRGAIGQITDLVQFLSYFVFKEIAIGVIFYVTVFVGLLSFLSSLVTRS
jgi:hypothetical protein